MFDFRISVIIPIYNAEKHMLHAVRSALDQSEVKEVLLVDDGSTDSSLILCNEIAQLDSRVRIYRHPDGKNHGAGASRNLGISKATEDYIAFLDADDYYLPNRFEYTKRVFQQNVDTDGVYECIGTDYLTDQARIDYQKTNRPQLTTVNNPNILPEELFEKLILNKYGYFSLDGLTLKRSVCEKPLQFDETLRIAQDTDFILRVAEVKVLRPGNIKQPVSMRGVHGGNRTLDTRNVLVSKEQFYKKWFLKVRGNDWPKSINRQFLIHYSLASVRIKTTGPMQWPFLAVKLLRNIFSHPWSIKKIV